MDPGWRRRVRHYWRLATTADRSAATIVGSRLGESFTATFECGSVLPIASKPYQQRLDKLTRMKIEHLDLSRALSDGASKAA
jgi:hypothetical protein